MVNKLLLKIPEVKKAIGDREKLERRVNDLENMVKSLESERDSLILCGRHTQQDDEVSPDFAAGTPPAKVISDNFKKDDVKILEIGSRDVTGAPYRFAEVCKRENYVGFDVGPGENVDVVGDAHELSKHFEPQSFDAVFSSAVFEHLAMPWIVAEEISKLLRPNGLVITFTHFSFSEHELPWHFFQFNKAAFRCLFNAALGFKEVDCYHSLPMVGRFAHGSPESIRGQLIGNLYCSTHHVARKNLVDRSHTSENFDWRGAISSVYHGTKYPGT